MYHVEQWAFQHPTLDEPMPHCLSKTPTATQTYYLKKELNNCKQLRIMSKKEWASAFIIVECWLFLVHNSCFHIDNIGEEESTPVIKPLSSGSTFFLSSGKNIFKTPTKESEYNFSHWLEKGFLPISSANKKTCLSHVHVIHLSILIDIYENKRLT